MFNIDQLQTALEQTNLNIQYGKIVKIFAGVVYSNLRNIPMGSVCEITNHKKTYLAEAVGFDGEFTRLMTYESVMGLIPGCRVKVLSSAPTVEVDYSYVGRVIDGMGNPIDGKGDLGKGESLFLYSDVIGPMQRKTIDSPLSLGVRSIDSFITVGRGQRVGILAGSGVGKSVLLAMMAKNTDSDINVIAFIGERGREVKDFIQNTLGEEGLKKSIIIAVTSDQSPLLRLRGAFLATTIAEYFSNKNQDVLLMMDSLTRVAMAQREIGLSVGEPPANKGYTPSVFSLLPRLLERSGSFMGKGSITGLYTVLVEGDDMDDPVADLVRSIVDGHIVLSRKLANKGFFPAIDVLQSSSRVMSNVTSEKHQRAAIKLRSLISQYRDSEDLINLGAYQPGNNALLDEAIGVKDNLDRFLKQSVAEKSFIQNTINQLVEVAGV